MITFTWSVLPNGLRVENKDGNTDTLVSVAFKVEATDGTHIVEMTDVARLKHDPATPFIPFADLTESQVLEWVAATLPSGTTARLESMLTKRIELLVNPPARPVVKAAPWAAKVGA